MGREVERGAGQRRGGFEQWQRRTVELQRDRESAGRDSRPAPGTAKRATQEEASLLCPEHTRQQRTIERRSPPDRTHLMTESIRGPTQGQSAKCNIVQYMYM